VSAGSGDLGEERRAIMEGYVDEARRDPNVLAVMLRGSVLHGRAMRNSDLDIRLIVESGPDESERESFEGAVPVHVIAYSRSFVESAVVSDDLIVIDLIRNDRILWDPSGFVGRLRERLRTYRPPASLVRRYLDVAKARMISALGHLERGDAQSSTFCVRAGAETLATALLLSREVVRPKQQWLVRDLRRVAKDDEELARVIVDCLGLAGVTEDEAHRDVRALSVALVWVEKALKPFLEAS